MVKRTVEKMRIRERAAGPEVLPPSHIYFVEKKKKAAPPKPKKLETVLKGVQEKKRRVAKKREAPLLSAEQKALREEVMQKYLPVGARFERPASREEKILQELERINKGIIGLAPAAPVEEAVPEIPTTPVAQIAAIGRPYLFADLPASTKKVKNIALVEEFFQGEGGVPLSTAQGGRNILRDEKRQIVKFLRDRGHTGVNEVDVDAAIKKIRKDMTLQQTQAQRAAARQAAILRGQQIQASQAGARARARQIQEQLSEESPLGIESLESGFQSSPNSPSKPPKKITGSGLKIGKRKMKGGMVSGGELGISNAMIRPFVMAEDLPRPKRQIPRSASSGRPVEGTDVMVAEFPEKKGVVSRGQMGIGMVPQQDLKKSSDVSGGMISGGGFWSDMWDGLKTGFAMPFQAAANVLGSVFNPQPEGGAIDPKTAIHTVHAINHLNIAMRNSSPKQKREFMKVVGAGLFGNNWGNLFSGTGHSLLQNMGVEQSAIVPSAPVQGLLKKGVSYRVAPAVPVGGGLMSDFAEHAFHGPFGGALDTTYGVDPIHAVMGLAHLKSAMEGIPMKKHKKFMTAVFKHSAKKKV